jgi:Cu(I)/Ag(I) efflux system membrane fusion protein/cobalt-zinc-cadmium efflux system membrane fusion protein
MYADVTIFSGDGEEGLIIPSEAVIRSGERNVVFVAREENKFTPREVTLGPSLEGRRVQVLTGLAPGETIVTSGQFMLDSESKLKEAVQKMMEVKTPAVEKTAPVEKDFFSDFE